MDQLAMTARARVAHLSRSLRGPSGRPLLGPRGVVLFAAVLATLCPLALTGADAAQPIIAAHTRTNPDVVVILTDDQRTDTLMSMPSVRRLLVDQGTRFTEAHVPNSLCCPSRATILTGLYSHNNGVWANSGPHGGWRMFVKNGDEKRTIAVTMQRAGYRTALIGKYLNQFGRLAPVGYSPVGWNNFQGMRVKNASAAYYNYRLGNSPKFFGEGAQDYSTDVLAHRAVNFIWSTPRDKSLFLYFAPYAPHAPFLAAPRDWGALVGKLPTYRPASSTASLADKPAYMRGRAVIPQQKVDHVRLGQYESLIAVDEAVSAIVAALEHSDRLRDTMIVFMSDNGYLDGDHRLFGKNVPYQQATSIPLVIRWDGRLRAGVVDNRMTGNIDIAATIADAAGTTMKTDGQSLLGSQRRSGLVLEAGAAGGRLHRPAYCGWRDADWLFVHYSTGEEELYSVPNDPQELHNLASDPAHSAVLASLRATTKGACRPMPPDFHW
jgi:N-acetylglucosamine-6-sulfatase